MNNKKILIIGLGLLGGSYAKGLTEKGYTVDAIDIDPYTIAYAKEKGYIQNGKTENYQDMVKQADRIIFGLYPKTMLQWIKDNHHLFKKGLIFTDVAGVKGSIVDTIQNIIPEYTEYIPSHPMAGKETSSIKYANTEMFKPANFIITPTEKNTEKGLAFANVIAEELEFANICCLTTEEHDQMIGYVSQLTHAIAVSLMCANDKDLVKYTVDSFRDLTRIAKINENMWSELFFQNKENLIQEIEAFTDTLNNLKNHLETNNEEKLKEMFRLSTERRKKFDKK